MTKALRMSMLKDERERLSSTPLPPKHCMFIQLVGIPVPQDGSGVVTIGDVPVPHTPTTAGSFMEITSLTDRQLLTFPLLKTPCR